MANGEGTGRGSIYPQVRYEYVEPADLVTTNSYVAMDGTVIDTALKGLHSVCYKLSEVVAVKGITFAVQGAVEDVDGSYVDVKTHDELGVERGSVDIAVTAGATVHAVIPASGDVGAKGAFRYYRVRVKSTLAGQAGTGRARGFAK